MRAFSNSTDEIHSEVEGLTLTLDGGTPVTVRNGVTTGSLSVVAGQTSSPVAVTWLDPDGDQVPAGELDADYSLIITSNDSNLITVALTSQFTFTVTGLQAGTANIQIQLGHNGHPDFTTPNIEINVTSV